METRTPFSWLLLLLLVHGQYWVTLAAGQDDTALLKGLQMQLLGFQSFVTEKLSMQKAQVSAVEKLLDQELKALQKEMSAIKSVSASMDIRLRAMQSGLSSTTADVKAIQSDLPTMSAKMKSIQSELSSLKTVTKDVQQGVVSTRNDLKALFNTLFPMANDMKSTKNELSSVKNDVKEVKSKVSLTRDDMKTIQINLSSMDTNIKSIQSQQSSVGSDVKAVQSEVMLVKNDVEHVLMETTSTRTVITQYHQLVASMNQQQSQCCLKTQEHILRLAPTSQPPKPTTQPQPTCRPGYAHFENSCYKIECHSGFNWYNALSQCQVDLGHLVTINSQKENDYLKSLARQKCRAQAILWTGATDRETEGVWKWQDTSSKLEYTNWKRGQPNFTRWLREDCMVMHGKNNYEWFDVSCATRQGYICERELF